MPNTFSLRIVATDRVFYDGRCEMLTVPALDGEMTLLAHHENTVIALDMGELRFRNEKGELTERSHKIISHTPMGRFGELDELTGTLLWLSDDEFSGFVTGIVVPVDGGFSAYSGV